MFCFDNLPQEIIGDIFQFDNTFHEVFDNVMRQLMCYNRLLQKQKFKWEAWKFADGKTVRLCFRIWKSLEDGNEHMKAYDKLIYQVKEITIYGGRSQYSIGIIVNGVKFIETKTKLNKIKKELIEYSLGEVNSIWKGSDFKVKHFR